MSFSHFACCTVGRIAKEVKCSLMLLSFLTQLEVIGFSPVHDIHYVITATVNGVSFVSSCVAATVGAWISCIFVTVLIGTLIGWMIKI
jgi:hypothetical protein